MLFANVAGRSALGLPARSQDEIRIQCAGRIGGEGLGCRQGCLSLRILDLWRRGLLR